MSQFSLFLRSTQLVKLRIQMRGRMLFLPVLDVICRSFGTNEIKEGSHVKDSIMRCLLVIIRLLYRWHCLSYAIMILILTCYIVFLLLVRTHLICAFFPMSKVISRLRKVSLPVGWNVCQALSIVSFFLQISSAFLINHLPLNLTSSSICGSRDT